jgi:hypothetical protein
MTLKRLALLGVDPVLIGTRLRFIAPRSVPERWSSVDRHSSS